MSTKVGIDIGTENVKVVCIATEKGNNRLIGFGKLGFKDIGTKLKDFLLKSGVPMSDLRINIEDPSMRVRRLDLPEMTPEELPEAIRWGMKTVVDGDVEKYTFKFIEISNKDVDFKDKRPYLVFAIKNQAIESHLAFFKGFGIHAVPKVIEPDVGALQSIFAFTKGGERDTYEVLIDFGSALSRFIVMGKGSMLFSRPLVGCADSNFVDQLQRDLGVGREKADEIKRMYRSGGDLGLAEEAMKVFMNTEARFTSRVALEVQRSIDGFMIVFDRKAVTKINICGGGADWPGRIDHLKNTLGIECQLFDPFAKIDTSMFAVEALKKNKMMYAVAAGLAVD